MEKRPEKKKNRKMTREAIRHRRRNIILFTAECVVFLLLLMVIFFLYEVGKLNIQKLDMSKIATNEAVRSSKESTAGSKHIETSTDSEGNVIDIIVPDTERKRICRISHSKQRTNAPGAGCCTRCTAISRRPCL